MLLTILDEDKKGQTTIPYNLSNGEKYYYETARSPFDPLDY